MLEQGTTWNINPDMLAVVDMEGRFLATNPAWADGLPLAAAGFEALRYGKG